MWSLFKTIVLVCVSLRDEIALGLTRHTTGLVVSDVTCRACCNVVDEEVMMIAGANLAFCALVIHAQNILKSENTQCDGTRLFDKDSLSHTSTRSTRQDLLCTTNLPAPKFSRATQHVVEPSGVWPYLNTVVFAFSRCCMGSTC